MTYGIFTSSSVEKGAYHGLPKLEFSWDNWRKLTTFVKYMKGKERHPYVVHDARQLENANIISYETIGASVFPLESKVTNWTTVENISFR